MATPTLVQHTNCQWNLGNGTTTYKMYFPHPVSNADAVFVHINNNTGIDPSGVSDGTAYTKFGHKDDGNNRLSIWYRLNVTDSVRSVTVTYASDTTYVQAGMAEWANIKTSSATDGSNGGSGSGTGLFSNNVTTAVDGDLIIAWAWQTATTGTIGSWAADTSPACSFSHADINDGSMLEYHIQTTHGAIELEATQDASRTWCMFACAFQNATAGTVGGVGGPRVLRTFHMSLDEDLADPPNSWAFQAPTSGSGKFLMIQWNGAAELKLTAVSDNKSNTWNEVLIGGVSGGYAPGGGPGRNQIWYAYNATGGSDMTVTITYGASGNTGDSNLIFWECDGLMTSGDPFDVVATATGTQSSGTSFTGGNITPTTSDGLVFAYIGAATGADSNVLDNTGFGNFIGPIAQDSTGAVVNTAPVGENQGPTVLKNTSTATKTSQYSTRNHIGVWADLLVAFKAPSTGGGILINGGGLTHGSLIRGGRLAA